MEWVCRVVLVDAVAAVGMLAVCAQGCVFGAACCVHATCVGCWLNHIVAWFHTYWCMCESIPSRTFFYSSIVNISPDIIASLA